MATIDKLNKILQTKDNIKASIESKGVEVSNIPFSEYAEKIEEITEAPKLGISYKQNESNPELLDATIHFEGDKIPDLLAFGANGYIAGTQLYSRVSSIKAVNPFSKVGDRSFANNTLIKKIENMMKLSEVGDGAFYQCENLLEVNLEDSIEELKDYSFSYCKKLNINLPQNLKVLGSMSLVEVPISLTNLPQGLEIIKGSALTRTPVSIKNFPPSLKTIENSGMSRCLNLTTINLPGVETLGSYAFEQSINITEATLGSAGNPVISMGRDVFGSCVLLKEIKIYVEDISKPNLNNAPWGATNATITYLQA